MEKMPESFMKAALIITFVKRRKKLKKLGFSSILNSPDSVIYESSLENCFCQEKEKVEEIRIQFSSQFL